MPLIGKEFIQNLAVDQDCKSFTQGKKVMLCEYCSKLSSDLDLMKAVFLCTSQRVLGSRTSQQYS